MSYPGGYTQPMLRSNIFTREVTNMNDAAHSRENQNCKGCMRLKANGPATNTLNAKQRRYTDEMPQRLLPGDPLTKSTFEKYLQIPTYLRWGRRLT